MSRAAKDLKYANIRRAVYEETVKYAGNPSLKLTEINEHALQHHAKWPDIGREPPNGGWDWRSFMMGKYKKESARFELAIWHRDQLCGLSAGLPSGSKILLKIELIEGTTASPNPLKNNIVPLTLTCAELYGIAIGSEEVRITEPVSGLIGYYESFDYTYVAGNKRESDYLVKRIED
ncbi:hypothetical protein [Hahella ganghwensis]|uniref:hypothetical protein n=1 Tax=Hahella ganghwensis TaxID=286420 RepID=UPI000376A356|nr:hypothetical protein [Hahella ganghwensis]